MATNRSTLAQMFCLAAILQSYMLSEALLANSHVRTLQKTNSETTQASRSELSIPAGTILPVRLNTKMSSKDSRPGQPISGRIMQDVPLPNGQKIKAGSKVSGKIVSTTPSSTSSGGQISFQFDVVEIHHQKIPVQTSMRAMASSEEIISAQVPPMGPDYGTPSTWVTTNQVGGDTVYGVGGPVTNFAGQTVGTALSNGVLVKVSAKAGTRCRGEVDGNDQPQALWLFSADACGIYGYPQLRIRHAGRSEPARVITLAAVRGEVKVLRATGMLLRVSHENP
jgi:hypothetical protein